MTNAQHTPGPWDSLESNNSNFIHVEQYGTGEQICTVNKGNREQRLANAYLIAAAPCLLEALEQAVKNPDGQWYDAAILAIAKATQS